MLSGTRRATRDHPPEVGDIIYIVLGEHRGHYRVTHATERDDHPALSLLSEAAWDIPDPVEQRHHQISLSFPSYAYVDVLGEHSPACRACGGLWPCQHARDMDKMDRQLSDMEEDDRRRARARENRRNFRKRYSTPGVCPACEQVVAYGQPAQTFEINAVVKNGPPVTYHVSRRCGIDTRHHSMHDYQQRLTKMKENDHD